MTIPLWTTSRRWEGEYTFKTVIEGGTSYIRVENGRAAEDHWLTLHEANELSDTTRFSFVIDTSAAQSMLMSGNATETGIQLTWKQDDYPTLAGYNIYRSDKEDGLYTRLNKTFIPADECEFFDDTVEPGKLYYYNFTVVFTDMTESKPSGKITIRSMDTMAPDIYHSPVYTAYNGSKLLIPATVTDNLGLNSVKLYYRVSGSPEWNSVEMARQNDRFVGAVPGNMVTLEGLEYYIEAYDGVNYTYKGNAEAPFSVTVLQAVDASSKGDVNGDGIITNLDALMILQAVNDLLNLTEEQFLRADIDDDGELSAAEAMRVLQYVSGKVKTILF